MPQATPSVGQDVLAGLARAGLLADVRPVPPEASWLAGRAAVAVVEGALAVAGRTVAVQVGLPAEFPHQLPIVAVNPAGEFGASPHVEPDGAVCYRPQDEPLLDRRDPSGILAEAVVLAADTLRAGLEGGRAAEYASEVAAYWGSAFPQAEAVVGVLDPADAPRMVTAFHDAGDRITVAGSPAEFASFRAGRDVAHLTFVNAVYVPVDPASEDPGFHPRDLATADGVARFAIPALRGDGDLWRRMLKRCNARDVLVVMGVRRPQGRRGLVGVLLRRDKEGSNTLDPERLRERRIEPVRIIPADPGFLLPRGGADLALTGRRVLLVGCGAVGGHVAFDLVKAGVGEIHLLDHDRFEYANAFRHVCGRARVREHKALGVAAEILRLWPFVKAVPHVENVLARLRTRPESLREYDLVVSAVGNPTVDLRLNEVIHGDPAMPPAVFAWLEPLGLGGHVLATHVRADPRGCYECLYRRESRSEPLVCRAAFAAPGGRYTRDTLGCGSQHMAFADLDAQRTAANVARRAVDLLRGTAGGGGLVSWKGPADAFLAAGFATTRRYELSPAEESLPGPAIARPDCPVCRTP